MSEQTQNIFFVVVKAGYPALSLVLAIVSGASDAYGNLVVGYLSNVLTLITIAAACIGASSTGCSSADDKIALTFRNNHALRLHMHNGILRKLWCRNNYLDCGANTSPSHGPKGSGTVKKIEFQPTKLLFIDCTWIKKGKYQCVVIESTFISKERDRTSLL